MYYYHYSQLNHIKLCLKKISGEHTQISNMLKFDIYLHEAEKD